MSCAHSFFPFFPDIMEATDWGVSDSDNAEAYDLSQRQRTCERNIREFKSRVNTYRAAEKAADGETAALLKDDKDAAQAKVRSWQAERDRVASKRGGAARKDREVATIR